MVRINLLPVRVSKKKEAGKQQLLLFVVLLVGGVVLNFLLHEKRAGALAAVEAELKETRTAIAELDKVIEDVDKIKAEEALLKKKLETLDALRKGRTGPVKMLSELADNMPRRLWLKKMDEAKGKVIFTGSASSIDDVSEFIRKLKESRFFTGVELIRTEAKSSGTYRIVDFEIHATGTYSPGVTPPAGAATGGKG